MLCVLAYLCADGSDLRRLAIEATAAYLLFLVYRQCVCIHMLRACWTGVGDLFMYIWLCAWPLSRYYNLLLYSVMIARIRFSGAKRKPNCGNDGILFNIATYLVRLVVVDACLDVEAVGCAFIFPMSAVNMKF